MTVTAAPRPPKLRADATRNRERIITAAREAFVEHGADAPLDEIAKRAGVGNATLYRNFPDRAALFRAVVLHVKTRIVAHAEAALADHAAPFDALQDFVHAAADEKLGALCPMISGRFDPFDPELVEARSRLEGTVTELLDRARRSGALRADVGAGDVFVAISQLTRPLPGSTCLNFADFVHRHLQLFLDGMRAPAPSTLPGRAITFEDFQHHTDATPGA
ncbi:TetR/AcrR family transcriptional regulator [Kitasatospora sp. NBC_00240]|uniref:TetR/AcrR family transcriptional regulator n=1 Tax=Kitasatospora sp. NBC_00240 TaxID=2903567 RepID=UPI00224C9396|nr:TetR/AcrR family transcriptional regulator [Kitasatospora sp. NBC_00240]MCX5213843.1 TetR/AcrR family transcriptional regulator [Kitasatospora sp. NBC_00240]